MQTSVKNPARMVPLLFLAAILFGTVLLSLPIATTGAEPASFLTAVFVATSAVGVTGLSTVDTATYWSGFGQFVIYFLFHLGGFGIMSAATLLGMVVSRKIGLGRQLIVQAEARGISPGDVRSVLQFVFTLAVIVEVIAVIILTWRIMALGEPFAEALWYAAFSVGAALTNAGFSNYGPGYGVFRSDAVAQLTLIVPIIIGGLGLPVLHDLRHGPRRRWSLHTQLTVLGSIGLTVLGLLWTLAFEWNNPGTLGGMTPWDKVWNALFHAVNTRSGGMNMVDNNQFNQETMMFTYGLMFTGAGSAGMGGGIKVTTLMILILAVWSELRGDDDTTAFGRRISPEIVREAMTVVTLAVGVLAFGTILLRSLSDAALSAIVYEAISAFCNVGLSMGITPTLPPSAQWVIILLMFLGRVGIVTVATGLALRPRRADFRYPEERPIVG